MPRLNRDLQRRVAQRRERERRSETARTYRFTPAAESATVQAEETAAVEAPLAPVARETVRQTREPVRTLKPKNAPRPFSSYAAEYGYVAVEMKRVAVVTTVLLLLMIALSFVVW